jgi:hypothetical protein
MTLDRLCRAKRGARKIFGFLRGDVPGGFPIGVGSMSAEQRKKPVYLLLDSLEKKSLLTCH